MMATKQSLLIEIHIVPPSLYGLKQVTLLVLKEFPKITYRWARILYPSKFQIEHLAPFHSRYKIVNLPLICSTHEIFTSGAIGI